MPVAVIRSRTSRPRSGCAGSSTGARYRSSRLPECLLSRHHSPDGGTSDGDVANRASRATRTTPSRTAICGSSRRTEAVSPGSTPALPASRSSSTNRPGCSDWALRTSPHTAAAAGSVTSSTAPRVTTTSRAGSSSGRASQSCSTPSTRAAASWAADGPAATPPPPISSTAQSGTTPDSASSPGEPAVVADSTGARPKRSSPRTAHRCPAGEPVGGTVSHSSRSRDSRASVAGAAAPAAVAERSSRDSTEITGLPATSVAASDTASPCRRQRTRSTVAPPACRLTPLHEKGSRP